MIEFWSKIGLKKAIKDFKVENWLIKFFEKHKQSMKESNSETIISYSLNIDSPTEFHRSISMDCYEDNTMCFVILDENCNEVGRFNVGEDISQCSIIFNEAFNTFISMVENFKKQ